MGIGVTQIESSTLNWKEFCLRRPFVAHMQMWGASTVLRLTATLIQLSTASAGRDAHCAHAE